MTDAMSHQERWGIYLVQAQNFAKRENYVEAVSRVQLVLDEVEAAVAGATGAAKVELDSLRHRAKKQRDTLQAQLDSWNAAIAARRAKVIAGAADEMARPLPNPPPPPRRA